MGAVDIGKTIKYGKLGEVDTKLKMISDSNWIPPPCYAFPQKSIGKSKRGFNGELLSRYPWLRYSNSEDAVYCVDWIV